MSGPEVYHLFHHPISDHSFSADRQTLAVARDNNVELYNKNGAKFNLKDELKGHDKTVTGVDIAPNSGMIVTCSQGLHTLLGLVQRIVLTQVRPECLRVGAFSDRLEANVGPSPHQSRCHLRALVTIGEEVRGWVRCSCDSSLLLRRGERLVGIQASQEAYQEHYHHA